jgi:hypothetical protein
MRVTRTTNGYSSVLSSFISLLESFDLKDTVVKVPALGWVDT